MRHPYHVACSYAFTLNHQLYKDYVHTAWINHFKRTGDCLFTQATPYILTAVKFVHKRYLQDQYFEWRRRKYPKTWYSIDEETFPIVAKTPNPEALAISSQFVDEFNSQMSQYRSEKGHDIGSNLSTYLRLKQEGYKQVEISEKMGLTPQVVNYYNKKIKTIIQSMNNPLRTSTVPISKRITRKTYEEKYKEEYNQWEDGNEFFNIYHNGKDYILVKEKEG